MKIIALSITFLFISSLCHAEEWTKSDTKRELVYMIFHVADWSQTLYISNHLEERHEINKVLGKYPSKSKVNLYFASTAVGHYVVSKALPPKWRKRWQYITIAVESGTVARNYKLGCKFEF